MTTPKPEPRVLLIGGSSHVGKSTLAASLGARPGWTHISTDSLARHPGRPWPQISGEGERPVPAHVAEHYLSLSVEDLLADVLRHYRSMWPGIEALITAHATDPDTERLVLEGSALWPDSVASLTLESVRSIWLTTSDEVFKTRIKNESDFENRVGDEKAMIEKFLGRALRYDEEMMQVVGRLKQISLNVGANSSEESLTAEILNVIEY